MEAEMNQDNKFQEQREVWLRAVAAFNAASERRDDVTARANREVARAAERVAEENAKLQAMIDAHKSDVTRFLDPPKDAELAAAADKLGEPKPAAPDTVEEPEEQTPAGFDPRGRLDAEYARLKALQKPEEPDPKEGAGTLTVCSHAGAVSYDPQDHVWRCDMCNTIVPAPPAVSPTQVSF
jgi:hypothetical protein